MISLAISGFCVGALTGLSVSPVVGIVLTSIVSALVALTSALAGMSVGHWSADADADSKGAVQRRQVAINPLPTAIVAATVTVGAIGGIWARTHGWLGTLPNAGTLGVAAPAKVEPPAFRAGVLFRHEAGACDDLWATDVPHNEDAFRASLAKTLEGDANLAGVVQGCRDRQCLQALLRVVCP